MECLMYNVPDSYFGNIGSTPLTDDLRGSIAYIWDKTKDGGAAQNWFEPNEVKPLFAGFQKWTMEDAHNLALNVWSLFKLGEDSKS